MGSPEEGRELLRMVHICLRRGSVEVPYHSLPLPCHRLVLRDSTRSRVIGAVLLNSSLRVFAADYVKEDYTTTSRGVRRYRKRDYLNTGAYHCIYIWCLLGVLNAVAGHSDQDKSVRPGAMRVRTFYLPMTGDSTGIIRRTWLELNSQFAAIYQSTYLRAFQRLKS